MRSLMVLGTASNVGKSVICTALCRIFHQDGIDVVPFKAQNMSLNSAATPSGREIGRAQAAQAEAAGIVPNEHMNPVLLKPTGDLRTQVVLQGQVYDTVSARHYFQNDKALLWDAVVSSYQYLRERHELIVMEGAGSPVEMNLKPRDIANLRVAQMADAAVVLVGDIDRGGVFASVVGTLQLMTPDERRLVKGIIINRFRGDPHLFTDGIKLLEEYTGVPVLGVIPYLHDIGIDEEDSVGLESHRYEARKASEAGHLRIAIVRLPHISNFTDFDPLFLEPDVHAYFTTDRNEAQTADAIIIPGTKSTMADLAWLKETGWSGVLKQAFADGTYLLGICGGYQMFGSQVLDPYGQEHEGHTECAGLALFPFETVMAQDKRTVLVEGKLLPPYDGISVHGYEIHMGKTEVTAIPRFAQVYEHQRAHGTSELRPDGVVTEDGRVVGTYLHGILHNDVFRTRWLNRLRKRKGLPELDTPLLVASAREAAYDRVADLVRNHLNMPMLYRFLTDEDGQAAVHDVESQLE